METTCIASFSPFRIGKLREIDISKYTAVVREIILNI